MSTAPPSALTTPSPEIPPAIPLTAENRAAYQDLYDKYEHEIENTTDAIALETLNDSRDEVKEILDMNDTYALKSNTDLFTELLEQIKDTNADLMTLKTEIEAVADHISTAAAIIAAIDKVITLVPAF